MDTENKIKTIEVELDKILKEFMANPEPGKILEIPHFGKLEYLSDRQVSYKNYKTGEEQIWQLPDSGE